RYIRRVPLPVRSAVLASAAAAAVLLAACGETPAYQSLENSIKSTITKDDHRPVTSVACTPHLKTVEYSDGIKDLRCRVRFKDGTSYTTRGTIEARSYQV